jgi:hypothetical protein
MMRSTRSKVFAVAIAVLCVAGYSTAQSATVAEYKSQITITDDPLDTHVQISTRRNAKGVCLSAFVDKNVFSPVIVLDARIEYRAQTFQFYDSLSYSTPEGPSLSAVKAWQRAEYNCKAGTCTFVESVFSDFSWRPVLDAIIKAGVPWQYRFNASTGEYPLAGEMSTAEIAALLERMDDYIRDKKAR